MGPPLRILHLEDEPDFCRLVQDILAREGLAPAVMVVSDLDALRDALEAGRFDIILSDYRLPTCTGIQALEEAARVCPETPFVLISGMIGEEAAIDALNHGATDYVLKQRPERLAPVVRRAVEDAGKRAQLGQAQQELAQRERYIRALTENALDVITERKQAEAKLQLQSAALQAAANAIVITDRKGHVTWANPAFSRLTGYSIEEALGRNLCLLKSGKHDEIFYRHLWETILAGRVWHSEIINRHKDGHLYTEETTITPVCNENGEIGHFIAVKQDIGERKRAQLELEQTHHQLLDVSRQAAVAQFATGILHNVGNVLNSVGVASACLAQSLRKSNSARLGQVVSLLREHEGDLCAFFTNDPKGKLVPGYLSQLAEKLAGEQAAALQEIAQLQSNLEHIRAIVSVQQDSAKGSSVPQEVDVTDLVENALSMSLNAITRSGIQVSKEFAEVPAVIIQKHEVLQILVNLIRNAVQACEGSTAEVKQLRILIDHFEDHFLVTFADNGTGISSDNLSRIFNLGFTTKKDGHGFGLHSAMVAAKGMGGSLGAQSDGLGKGATFTLKLPTKPTAAPDSESN